MTCEEFDEQFDVRLNTFAREMDAGEPQSIYEVSLDEYEKSCYLTQAQHDIVITLYNGGGNLADGFEGSEENRRYLNELVTTFKQDNLQNMATNQAIDGNTYKVQLPEDLMFIVHEHGIMGGNNDECLDGQYIGVEVTRHDYYNKQRKNPFRGANKRRVLRIDSGYLNTTEDNTIELISKYNLSSYYCRYLKKPEPIILIDLPDGLSVEGVTKKTECKLHAALHSQILDRAVQLAALARQVSKSSNA